MKSLLLIAAMICVPALAEKAPEPKTEKFQTPEGEMIIVRVPVAQLKSWTEYQICFVWRDKGGQMQMQCPSEQVDALKRDTQK